MEKILISTATLNKVLAYLGARPYQEVFQVIEAIQEEAKNQPQPPAVEKVVAEPVNE
jgi:hypothetical protein